MIATGLTRFSSFIYNTSSNLGLNSASQRTQVNRARKYCETLAHLTTSGRQQWHRRARTPWRVVLRWQPWQPPPWRVVLRLQPWQALAGSAAVAALAASTQRAGHSCCTGRCSCSHWVCSPCCSSRFRPCVHPDRIPAQAHALFVAPPPMVGEN